MYSFRNDVAQLTNEATHFKLETTLDSVHKEYKFEVNALCLSEWETKINTFSEVLYLFSATYVRYFNIA